MPRIKVPATTANLGPGFDSLGLALNLYDYIEVSRSEKKLEIEVSGEGSDSIPRGQENIAYLGAAAVFKAVGREVPGLKISFQNNIPVARGLGSSAAALIGGMLGANSLLGEPLNRNEVINLAAALEGHPDNVAAAVLGGMVVTALNGKNVYCQRLQPPQELHVTVAIPDFSVSTRLARSVLPTKVALEDAIFNVSRAALLVAAVAAGNLELMGKVMEDKLHQPYRLPLVPGLTEVFAAARSAGALAVALSGSGPTVVAFSSGRIPAIGEAMCKAFAQKGIHCKICELTPAHNGAEIEA
ncbi:MAG: homoserine kinase [Clostridia bacterium]|nr:homoserine kinase [Clostridia bacterium]